MGGKTESPARVRIDNQPHAMSGGHGKGTLLIGAVAVGAGTLPLLRALEVITSGRVNAPLWVVGWVGGIFIAIGLLAMALGLSGMWLGRRAAARRRQDPDRPELWDWSWDRDGGSIGDGGLRRSVQGALGGLGFVAFLVPFAWWAFLSGKGPWMVQLLVGCFGIIAVIVVGTAGLRLLRTLRFGESRLRLPHFPLRPGDRLQAELRVAGGLTMAERVSQELRFVEEVWEDVRRGSEHTRQQVRYSLWSRGSEREVAGSIDLQAGSVPITVELPADRPELVTRRSGNPVRYWELTVRVTRPGLDYVGAFPLPVYGAAPAGGTAASAAVDDPELARV